MTAAARTKQTQVLEREAIPSDAEELLDQVIANTTSNMGRTAKRYADALADQSMDRLTRAALMGAAITKLRAAITPELRKLLRSLCGSSLGFKTDRDKPKRNKDGSYTQQTPYSDETIERCFIEGLLHGVYPFNNEWNIIADSLYITQNGYSRKVAEIPGIENFELVPGVPFLYAEKQCVRVEARWLFNGDRQELKGEQGKSGRVFPIISNEYLSADALMGKAKRKALKAIYDQVVGSDWTPQDEELGEDAGQAQPGASHGAAEQSKPATRTEALADKLAKTNGTKTAPPAAATAPAESEPAIAQLPEPDRVAAEIRGAIAKAATGEDLIQIDEYLGDLGAKKYGGRWKSQFNDELARAWKRIEGGGE